MKSKKTNLYNIFRNDNSYERLNEAKENVLDRAEEGEYESIDDISDENAYEEINANIQDEFEEFMYDVKNFDKQHPQTWLVIADLGLWNGHHAGGKVCESLEKAIWACINNMDYIRVQEDRYGQVEIIGIHHDGTNTYNLYRLSAAGEKWFTEYGSWADRQEICETLDKPRNHRAARLREAFGWIDQRKEA